MKTTKKKKRIDYRYLICITITLASVICGVFLFPHALGRVIEGGRDFGLSVAYYFCEILSVPHGIVPTVNDLPKIPFFPGLSGVDFPAAILPDTFEDFKVKWAEYWNVWASKENLLGYLSFLGSLLSGLSKILLLLLPGVLLVYLLFNRFLSAKTENGTQDSRPLRAWKWLSLRIYCPVKAWFSGFLGFLREHSLWWKIWLALWLFYFNAGAIALEFLAFYLYFIVSFDFLNLYRQVYKLFIDLSVLFSFFPLWAWAVGFVVFVLWWRKRIALSRLTHFEMRNRGFINARPIVYMVCGTMGKKKTTAITDMALSQEVMFRDKAFEKILENDLKFPDFPWIHLENELKRAMRSHAVYNLATVRSFVSHIRTCFLLGLRNKTLAACCRRHLKTAFGYPYHDLCFGYDWERYGALYDDKLKIVDLWEVLETYAQLYFIYILKSSLLISNYSVRVDSLLSDLGNFPMWNSDFFRRDSRLLDSFSRHSHILDFDSLRLGRKVLEQNPNADNFEFGVVLITEVGKERGNSVELSEKKKKDETANQKNDLFNSWLKMVRHSATVDHFPFVRVIADEQRPESWGADARDLCEIVHIRESGETRLAMPFFALSELLYSFVFKRFVNLYYRYRYVRSDNTLTMYLLKTFTAKLHSYYTRVYNRFGYCVLRVQVESGTQDGEISENQYYLMNKKIYSRRFSTDCFADFFTEKALRAPLGVDDLREYVTERATFDELQAQNSYFIKDLLNGLKTGD